MSPVIPLDSRFGWFSNFGKRYLRLQDFVSLCQAVSLYGCGEYELEEYERERRMFPAARMVMPAEYASAFWGLQLQPSPVLEVDERFLPFHQLDWALRYGAAMPGTETGHPRHPIDEAWGSVDGLLRPRSEEYVRWEQYTIQIDTARMPTATHFYHYWQIYELYDVRRRHKGMYRDNVVLPRPDGAVFSLLEATSYFQHLYQLRRASETDQIQPDQDGMILLDQSQRQTLDQAAGQYAAETLQRYELNEAVLYAGLRGMMALHVAYEEADRFRLAEALKTDLWRAMQLVHFSLGSPTEAIAEQAGRVCGFVRNYLELLFPNRREQVRSKALRILRNLVDEHNAEAPDFLMSDSDLQELINYIEATDLAWFEYVMVELNTAFFASHSWRTAETFLHLKALASFPESFLKALILNEADPSTKTTLLNQPNPGLSFVIGQVFRASFSSLLHQYQTIGQNHWSAVTPTDFATNSQYLISRIASAQTQEGYVGANLALATLLRNFTSHHVVEDPQLLRGHYVRCVRAVLSSAFAAWKAAQHRGWIRGR